MNGRALRKFALLLAALALMIVAVTLTVLRTSWFREYVRQQIVEAAANATGGRVELERFDFDVRHVRATLCNFVIHGTEPGNTAPFVRVAKGTVEIGLFSGLRRLYEITYLDVDAPQINVIELADGRTNIPSPKRKSTSNRSALETVVDLAVRRFQVANGRLAFESHVYPLNIAGSNFVAQLSYNSLQQSYQGRVSLEPVYVVAGRNTPVNFTVTLPVLLDRDRIEARDASISTPDSRIAFNIAVENMRNPKFSGHIGGHIGLMDMQNLADIPLDTHLKGAPRELTIEVNGTGSNAAIDLAGLNVALGQSHIEGSGVLKDSKGSSSFTFSSQLAVAELGRLMKISAKLQGLIVVNGNASLDSADNYLVHGNIDTRDLAVQMGAQKIRDIRVSSPFQIDPHRVELKGFLLSAAGGKLTGAASLEDFAKYKLDANLQSLDLQTVLHALGQKLPYDGVISGPVSGAGNMHTASTKSLSARARLSLIPGRRGTPISGRVDVDYNGATDIVSLANSYLALPHTKVNLNGSTSNSLNVALTSNDLSDLYSPVPIVLNRGDLRFNGTVTGGFSQPLIAGHLAANRFSVEGRQFDSLSLDLAAASTRVSLDNGILARGPMRARFSATTGLKHWTTPVYEPVAADIKITDGDLADLVAIAGQRAQGFSGALTASVNVSGTIGNPQGSANLDVDHGTLENEPFDQLHVQANMTDQLAAIPTAFIKAPAGRLNLTAEFQHPRDSFSTGQVHTHLQSGDIDLAALRRVKQVQPSLAGTMRFDADLSGKVGAEGFLPTSVTADLSGDRVKLNDLSYGNLKATARTNGQTVSYNVTAGELSSTLRLNGRTILARDYPTSADANAANIPVDHLLALANRKDIPVRGNLAGTAHFDGTIQKPRGNMDLNLSRAVIYNEPVDNVRATIDYLEQSIELSRLEVSSGPARISVAGRYDHPASDLEQGNAQFNVSTTLIDLSRIRNVQKARPGLGGALQVSANGAARVIPGKPGIRLTNFEGRLTATGIKTSNETFGDLTLTANTNPQSQLSFALDSNLAGSSIRGRGTAGLGGDYPIDAQLTFAHVLYSRLSPLLTNSSALKGFDAVTDGEIAVSGPILNTNQLRGSLQVTKLAFTAKPETGSQTNVTISNQGNIAATLDRGVVQIQSARLSGLQTDLSASGSVSLTGKSLSLNLNAKSDLGVLPKFDPDIYSAGNVALAATVRGTAAQPLVTGQMALNAASFNYVGITNGLSNANGVIVFNGNNATIRSLTAESGGGKVTLSGFVGYANGLRFSLKANAGGVRVRAEQGVSIMAGGDIRLAGTERDSTVSGTVNIEQFTYSPQSDIGSILSRTAPPVQSASAPSPLLDSMKLQIRVRSAAGLAVQASLAQNLEADVDLRIRGTAAEPGVLGRIAINAGQLVFFGSSYTVDNGVIGFYNPVRIEPVLDVSLETQAQGVNVTLRVTGPIDNMQLSYTSDPPLQFQEIVSLLAAGRTPTSDATLLANQPQMPAQSFQQMGESAIVSKALADPVSSRLERVFGVTQLKIDPAFQAGSQIPTARLTLQQQITSNLTFTYTSALDDPNGQIIKIEWAFSPSYSAVANRDQNGIFSVNLFYKRGFR